MYNFGLTKWENVIEIFDAIIPSSGFVEVKKNWIKPSKLSSSFIGKFQTRLTVAKLEEASKKIVQVGIFQTGKEVVDFVKGSNKPQSTSSNNTLISSKVSSTIKKVVNKVISKVKNFLSNIKAINSRLFNDR